MLKLTIIPLIFFLTQSAIADDSAALARHLNKSIAALSETANACTSSDVSWPFTRADIHVGVSGTFGINDVLDLTVSTEIVFAFVRKGHEPD